jgi:hypothetical protein
VRQFSIVPPRLTSGDLATEEMHMQKRSKLSKVAFGSLLVLGLVASGSLPGFSRDKNETIDATAFGTALKWDKTSA